MSFSVRKYCLLPLLWIISVVQLSVAQGVVEELKQKLSKSTTDSAKADNLRAVAIYFMSNDLDSAAVYAEQLTLLGQKARNAQWQGNALNIKGLISSNTGRYESAIQTFVMASEFFAKAKDERGMGVVLSNVGNIYHLQMKYEKALKYYTQALEHFQNIDNQVSIARTLNGIASALTELKQYNKALRFQEKAIKLFIEIKDAEGLGFGYNNLAEVYRLQEDDKTALFYFEKALHLLDSLGEKRGRSFTLLSISSIELRNKNLKKSLNFAEKALKISSEMNALNEMNNAYWVMQEIYSEKKDYKKAHYYSVLHKIYSDSLYNEKINQKRTISDVPIDFKIKKEKNKLDLEKQNIINEAKIEKQKLINMIMLVLSISFLVAMFFIYKSKRRHKKLHKALDAQNKENQQQKDEILAKSKELEEANALKNRLFSLLANDLREPIYSMESVLAGFSSDMPEIEKRKVISELYKHVDYSSQLIDNLLAWIKIQIKGEYSVSQQFDLAESVEYILSLMEHQMQIKNLVLEKNIPAKVNVIADKNMIELVIKNLVANAIKHTEKGFIKITVEEKENKLFKVSIQDSGKGIMPEKMSKLFDKKNYYDNPEKKQTGLGLLLCKDFVEANGGKMSVSSEWNVGSTFSFTIPKNNQ